MLLLDFLNLSLLRFCTRTWGKTTSWMRCQKHGVSKLPQGQRDTFWQEQLRSLFWVGELLSCWDALFWQNKLALLSQERTKIPIISSTNGTNMDFLVTLATCAQGQDPAHAAVLEHQRLSNYPSFLYAQRR